MSAAPEPMAAKVARILAAFDRAPAPLRNADIAEHTGLSASSTARILKELVEHRLVERRGHTYVLGLKVFELGAQVSRPHHLYQLALATLTGLQQATGHTVHLAILDGRDVLYLETLPGPHCPPAIPQRAARRPAHTTAAGKALLAHYPSEWLDLYLRRPLVKSGPRTITSAHRLRQ